MEPTAFAHAGAWIEAAVFAPALVAVTVAIVRSTVDRRRVRAARHPSPHPHPPRTEEPAR